VTCSRGCRKTVATGRGARKVRIAGLRNRRLANGATITVSVSLKGHLTARLVDRIRHGRRSEGDRRCFLPSTTKPRLSC